MESVLLVSGNGRLLALAEALRSLGHQVEGRERADDTDRSYTAIVVDAADPDVELHVAMARLRHPLVPVLAWVPRACVAQVPDLLAAGVQDVLSEPLDTSSIDLRLMVARRRAAGEIATHAATKPAAPVGLHRRVLVVDDEPGILDVVAQMLRGNDVVCTLRAEEALGWLEGGQRYDLILCDLMMPEMTGMDLYLVVESRWPEVADRFVFLTGGAFTQRAREFLDSVAADRRVDKPFRAATIREIVGRA